MTSPSMQPQKGKPGNFGKGAPPAKAGEQGQRKPHLMGDPDPWITPSVTWGSGTVTISGIPQENSSDPTGVSIDGTAATKNSNGTWSASVSPRATGNSLTVTYSSTLSYANASFSSSTSSPRCTKV